MSVESMADLAARGLAGDREERTGTTRGGLRRILGVCLLVGALGGGYWLWSTRSGASDAKPETATVPPPSVDVSTPVLKHLADEVQFMGQFSAMDRVEVRAQVSGYLMDIRFKDGQIVHQGDLLFVIDKRPYDIALAQAKAQLESAQANAELTAKELQRAQSLKLRDFASAESVDQRLQQSQGAMAAVATAKAAVRAAELNLEFTEVRAPLTGKISSHRVSIGNLVSGGQGGATTLLTTIVSLDPIYLDFDGGEDDYIRYKKGRQTMSGAAAATARVFFDGDQLPARSGTLDFVDNEMDRSSGTIHARLTVDNHALTLASGQFAKLSLPVSAPHDVLLVPDSAVLTDQSQKLVMTVGPDDTIVPKQVRTGALLGSLRRIEEGLGPQDRVVVDGLMRVRPHAKVTPAPARVAQGN